MDKSNVKTFVRENKQKLIVGVGIVIGVVTCAIVRKQIHISKDISVPNLGSRVKDIKVPDGFSVGTVMDLFEDGSEIVAIAQNLTVNDLGKFGEELVKYGLVSNGAEAAITAEFLRNV